MAQALYKGKAASDGTAAQPPLASTGSSLHCKTFGAASFRAGGDGEVKAVSSVAVTCSQLFVGEHTPHCPRLFSVP